MNNTSLFICNTPLQCLIATKIIELKKLKRENCLLLFYNTNKNQQLIYNFNLFKNSFEKNFYNKVNRKFPFYLFEIFNLINKENFDNIYFASIDSIYIHYIISKNLNKNIYTFDDGNANITFNGHYRRNNLPYYKQIILFLFFKRKNIRKFILDNTINHFTIFKYQKNYVGNNFTYINLNFSNNNNTSSYKFNECSILLGTVENEALKKLSLKILEKKYEKLRNNFNHDFYYYPHPRGFIQKINGYKDDKNNYLISEIKIIKLFENYSTLNIYGFSSTVQINLIKTENINIIFLKSKFESMLVSNIRNIFCSSEKNNIKIIDIDSL